MANKFIIPSPWDPGYAIPKNIRREGLQTHAFVTQWSPRGTYDDPDPFDPSWDKSYAVPQYILDEGYGQGARVTEWAERGSYVGQVPAAVRQTEQKIATAQRALGDTAMPKPFGKYGRRAAAVILARVRSLPPPQRKEGLRQVMNAIDPSLYGRTASLAQQYTQRGVAASTALELALAKSMSSGIATELVQVGKSGRRPKARGQLGLGCYGCAAVLGDTATPKTLPSNLAAAAVALGPPSVGMCSADGMFIWSLAEGVGYWKRRVASDVCTGTYTGAVATGGAQGGITGAGSGGEAPVIEALKVLEVGPFRMPLNVGSYTINWSQALPGDWQGFLVSQLAKDADRDASGTPYNPKDGSGNPFALVRPFIPGAQRVNRNFIGFDLPEAGWNNVLAPQPIVVVTRPDTNEDWAIYFQIGLVDRTKPFAPTGNPMIARLLWRKKPLGVWDWIKRIVGKIVDVATSILDAVGGLACTLLGSQGAAVAAGAAAASQGAPPEAGAQGVAIASQACGTAPPGGGGGGGDDWLLPAALIGGGVLLVAALFPKKKKAP